VYLGKVRFELEDRLVFANRGIEVSAFLRGLRRYEVLFYLRVKIRLLRSA
jgi:hypothetical protein